MRFGQFVRLWGLAWRSFGACVTEGFGDFDCFGLGFGAGLGLGLRPWSGEWGKLKVGFDGLGYLKVGDFGGFWSWGFGVVLGGAWGWANGAWGWAKD